MDAFWSSFGVGDPVPANSTLGAHDSTMAAGIDINTLHDNSTEQLHVDCPPVLPARRGARKVGKRDKNFSHLEDELLCSAWANVSKDPITGISQTSGGYWKRFHDYFHANKTFESERTQIAIQHRWGLIQKETSKFCGYKAQIDRRNESGKGEKDRVSDALKLHNELEGHPFQLIHCWMLLKNGVHSGDRAQNHHAGDDALVRLYLRQ